ncbi:MAG: hypothetical protein WCT22_00285 [Patescibacteria group bacterium]
MLTQRIKILASMLIAFILVEGYTFFSQNPNVIPTQAENIKGLLSNLKFNPSSFTRLFTLNFSDSNNLAQVNSGSTGMNGINNGPPPIYVPPTKPIKPIQPTRQIQPIKPTPDDELVDFPFEPGDINNLGGIPTNPPKPTNKPKPTKPPALPAITTPARPGSTLSEIFAEVSKRECIPAALLHAFQTQETGPWWPFDSPSSKVKIYNKFGWWTDGSGNSCTGMGYHTQTGIVPSDATDAGTVCQNPIPSGADQAIMGIIQISQEEEDAAKKYTTSIIKGDIDRRVLFDNTLIFAIITKNRLGDPPTNCNDWPDDAIRTAAEKHYGACSDNYCENILKYYKEYK